MDLYLSNCLKAAAAAAAASAASNVASDKLNKDKESCKTKIQKPTTMKIGPSSLLDLPLGAKLPIIPGSTNIFYTTNISEKLYQPSFGFNLSDPYCKLMETSYKNLHDPHLKSYFKRKDILKRLKQDGFITSNNKVICSLKELNNYRQYLTSLKIDFERNYIREQKMLESQMNKLNEERRTFDDNATAAEFQRWLLQEGKKAIPNEDRVLKLRHLRMINKELDKIDDTLGRRNTLQLEQDNTKHWNNVRRKLMQNKQIKKDWQSKEMEFLARIGEEVKRESSVEERCRKMREEIKQKKQVMLEKRIAFHLQKLLKQEEKPVVNVPEGQTQPETASSTTPHKLSLTEQNTSQEHQEQKQSTESITSIPDQRLLEESRESKYTSQATKVTFDEEKSSFYELLDTKFTLAGTRRLSLPIGTRSSSLPTGTGRSSLLPTDRRTSSLPIGTKSPSLPTGTGRSTVPTSTRKASLPIGTRSSSLPIGTGKSSLPIATRRSSLPAGTRKSSLPTGTRMSSLPMGKTFQEFLERTDGPVTSKRTSFISQKFMEDFLEAKYLYPYATRTSFTHQKPTEDNLGPKSLPNVKKTSFDEDEAFQKLMEAITPPEFKKKTSYTEHRLSQESMESNGSSQYSQSDMKVFIRTSTASLLQQRDEQNKMEQKNNESIPTTSHHSIDRGVRRISIPHFIQASEVSRHSLDNIPKQETDTYFKNTHQQNK